MVTLSEANRILDKYQTANNCANRTRDPNLLAKIEAGQLFARSKAELEQLATLTNKERQDYGEPFTFRDRTFYLPAGGNWFAAEATTTGKNRTVMVFEKSTATGGVWKKVASLFPEKPVPTVVTSGGVARAASTTAARAGLTPNGAGVAVEDLFATGGKKQGGLFSRENANVKSILKTYRQRGDDLGRQAKVNFFPASPVHKKVYALHTRSGVLVVAPLAHNEESLVTNSAFQITPGKVGSVYDKTPRAVTVDVFQGEALVFLPSHGKPEILDYRYAQTDSH
ncbi:hypothetical protein OG458_42110 (plasmid) [Streptomyces sp. NBC_01281]|uniref:hypothetical protein n=1 Tax=Streptomyces sp. NBC_01281 TaxID=2903811 RepID=UPI002E120E6C|nr:hypothetical protein OG458_42110 [Streptomyces sp. NBC_01281]